MTLDPSTPTSPDPLPKVWDPDSRVGDDMLRATRGLVVGIANSVASAGAVKLRAFGAELAVTCLNEKAERHVRLLAEQLKAKLILPMDVEQPGPMDRVVECIASEWGRLDFVAHIAEVGRVASCLVGGVVSGTIYVDAGPHIMA